MTKIMLSGARLLLILAVPVVLSSMVNSLPDSDSKPKELVGPTPTGGFAWLDTWKPPGRLQEWFPFFEFGKDFEGSPVFLCPYGRWDLRKVVFQGTKEEKDAMETYVKYIMATSVHEAVNKSETGSNVMIYDWDGFALANYAHPEAFRMTLYIFRELVEAQKAVSYGFCINTNFAAESFLKMAKPFLGTYLDKLETYGTQKEHWLPRLLAKIPPDSLITKYGGTMEIEDFKRN